MFPAIALILMCQTPTQGWHWEKHCDGRSCYYVKVKDTAPSQVMPNVTPPAVAPQRLPELLTVPPAPVVSPLPIERQYFFGVDRSKLPDRDKYAVGDVEVTRDVLSGTFQGDSPSLLPADSGKPHLTLFGRDESTRKQLETMIASADAAELREAYRVQVYDASHKVDREMTMAATLEKDKRFLDSGKVAVLQAPSATGQGKVWGALFAWQDAKELVSAVPKFDPNFKLPDKTRDSLRTLEASQVIVTLAVLVFLTCVVQSIFSNRNGARKS